MIEELFLTESWEGVDRLYVLSEATTSQGKRKLLGFCAAGGTVIVEGESLGLPNEVLVKNFGAEGFEPPAYWSQTSRASQTALCPAKKHPTRYSTLDFSAITLRKIHPF